MRKPSIGVFAIVALAASINVAAAQRVEPTPMAGGGPGASRPQAKVLLRQYHRILRLCRWRAAVPVRCRRQPQLRHPLNVRTLATNTITAATRRKDTIEACVQQKAPRGNNRAGLACGPAAIEPLESIPVGGLHHV